MSTLPGVVTAVRWTELCPWLLLVRAARAALLVRVLVLAALGVWATQWGWRAIERAVLDEAPSDGVQVAALARLSNNPPAPLLADSPGMPAAAVEPFELVDDRPWAGPLVRGWAWALQPLTRLAAAPTPRAAVAFTLAGIWVMAVWALAGGAIGRIAALYLARGEMLGPLAALRAAASKWFSTMGAPAICFGALAALVAMLVVVGFVIRANVLALLAGLAWPAVIVLAVAIALLALGLLVGWPLMWSTVAAERSDAFDAISRGYGFTYQRPLHLVFFILVATVLGLLAQTLVTLLVEGALQSIEWGVRAGAGEEQAAMLLYDGPRPDGGSPGALNNAASGLIRFWNAALASLATAFPMAYLWPAAMAIYLLLRRLIDSTELGEVQFDEGPAGHGLPPLVKSPTTGIPAVSSAPAVPPAASPGTPATPTAAPPAAPMPAAPAAATETVTELRSGPS
ncbi:MAG TPA: hypothetical protein VEQ85_02460 [Lacipirellulaceae bacterium]|nr:hypothetical protein [Lacipirellulaceae bacterium]